MSCGKRWKWHLRDPRLKNVLGEHALRPPTLGHLRRYNFPRLRTPSEPHATSTLNSSSKTLSWRLCFQSHTTLLWYVTRPPNRLSSVVSEWLNKCWYRLTEAQKIWERKTDTKTKKMNNEYRGQNLKWIMNNLEKKAKNDK